MIIVVPQGAPSPGGRPPTLQSRNLEGSVQWRGRSGGTDDLDRVVCRPVIGPDVVAVPEGIGNRDVGCCCSGCYRPHTDVVGVFGESSGHAEAMHRGFEFARDLGIECGPVHFLVGIAEGGGPLRAALTGRGGQSLRSAYLHMQAQGAAQAFAASRGEPVGAGHLLIALLDQAEPRVVEVMRRACVDADTARSAALRAIGASPDQPRIVLAPLTAAGILDRPPLPLSELPVEAWAALQARQGRMLWALT